MDITDPAYGHSVAAPKAPGLGAKISDFILPSMLGEEFALYRALERGPVVLVFFRGFW